MAADPHAKEEERQLMTRARTLVVMVLALALLAAACSDDDAVDADSQHPVYIEHRFTSAFA